MFEDSSAAKADKAVAIAITSANVIDFILNNRLSATDWPQLENPSLVLAEYLSGRDVTYGDKEERRRGLAALDSNGDFRYERIFEDLRAKRVPSTFPDVVLSDENFPDMKGCSRLQLNRVCLARGEHENNAVAETKVPRRHSSVIPRGEVPRID